LQFVPGALCRFTVLLFARAMERDHNGFDVVGDLSLETAPARGWQRRGRSLLTRSSEFLLSGKSGNSATFSRIDEPMIGL
jgi:hypothetical protein